MKRILMMVLGCVLGLGVKGGEISVVLGRTVGRSFGDVESGGMKYGVKQEYDAGSGETRVWLPYGVGGMYYETEGLVMSDAGSAGTGCALATTVDGNTRGSLVYKMRFDKAIGAFRIFTGWSEWGAGAGTVGVVEYSVNGKEWRVLRKVEEGGIVEPLLDASKVKVEGLNTRVLYVRYTSRNEAEPESSVGPNRWMKLRLSGDPAWGDRAETFFQSQVQVWVKASGRDAPEELETLEARGVPKDVRTHEEPLGWVGPWGIASGAEWSGEYGRFNPMLREAGVQWLRYFPEWHSIQPREGEWRWEGADAMVADARKNGIQMTGAFAYFAPWASADGGMRRGPVKDVQFWRDYVAGVSTRYQNDIRHWEVWNEFNGSFYQGVDKPAEYAELVVAAYEEVKRANPEIALGLSVANFDVGFLDATIKAGAADHFDFVCVHPYENTGMLKKGGEAGFLSLAGSLRRMLRANGQREDIGLWITETGVQSRVEPDAKADEEQAEVLVKLYTLALAQGFERVCWFEARGPAYGHGTDHGLIRRDWTVRPAYTAMKTMTGLLGEAPEYVGWLKVGDGGFGFVFRNGMKAVLVAWASAEKEETIAFEENVTLHRWDGQKQRFPKETNLKLSGSPVFVTSVPAEIVAEAEKHRDEAFPWGTDFSKVPEAVCRLGGQNQDAGVSQVNPQTTAVGNGLTESWRRTNFAHGSEGHYVYFRADPTFVGFGNKRLEITVVARRAEASKEAGMNLCYESLSGYRTIPGAWFGIPAGEGWHEYTWRVEDANFVGGWGWNFRLDAIGSPNEFCVREVRVRRLGE